MGGVEPAPRASDQGMPYNVPPPPIPVRATSSDMPSQSNPFDLPPLPPKDIGIPLPPPIGSVPPVDPASDIDPALFDISMFPSLENDDSWGDIVGTSLKTITNAVYDTAKAPNSTSGLPIYSNDLDDINVPINIIHNDVRNDSLDFTGGSSFEEQMVIEAIRRSKEMEESAGQDTEPTNVKNKVNEEEDPTVTNIDSVDFTPPGYNPYDFPNVLDKHPRDADSNHPPQETRPKDMYEEPPMELLTFAKKEQPKPKNDATYSSVYPSELGPLPPLPNKETTSPEQCLRSRSPVCPADPPLPPRNTSRVNGQLQEPPLPPRNRVSASPGPSVGRTSDREQMISTFMNQGFSRADIIKAMAISQNNMELAKMILDGFGSKN